MRLKRKTTAPTGHSTTPATTNAKNPRVGPSTLHRQGLLVVPHWTHIGKPTPRVILFIASNCPQQDENNTKRQIPRKNKRLFENCEASNGLQKGKLTKKTASMVEISGLSMSHLFLRSLWMIFYREVSRTSWAGGWSDWVMEGECYVLLIYGDVSFWCKVKGHVFSFNLFAACLEEFFGWG